MQKYKQTIIAIILFVTVGLLFNFPSWQEVFTPTSTGKIAIGDSTLAEFIIENNYQNIISGKNPFIIKEKLFYPYEINVSLNDPGTSNILFYMFLRPFFDIHQSMLFIVLLNSFLSNIFMYMLLRKLNIDDKANLIASLSFGFMPTVPYRLLGHYTYTSIYLFPLLFLLFIYFIEKKDLKKKLILSFLLGKLMAFILLLNFYFFITILLGFLFYALYFFFASRKQIISFFINHVFPILLSPLPFTIILIPWFIAVSRLFQFEGIAKTPGFGGAQVLSADLLGFITPSEYNPLYNFLILKLGQLSGIFAKYTKFYLSNWEKFVYPGVFIWGSYLFLIFFRKKIPRLLWDKIKPHFTVSLIFAIITLGPFLKIANRWMLTLDEGIQLVFPLPFLLLHYIPGLSSVRAPTRFTPAFLFLAYIVVGYLFHYFFTRLPKKKYFVVLVIIFLIFFIDHFYILPKRETTPFPLKAYEYLKKQPGNGTVLEIPFTVRDGFQYIGFVHAIGPMYGQFYHNKPIIGGYFARINPAIFTYYKELPFTGYVSRIIDKGNYEPSKEKPKEAIITPFTASLSDARREIDFLNLQYILLKTDEKYSPVIKDLIFRLGFIPKFQNGTYYLYEYKSPNNDFAYADFGSLGDELFTGQGFSIRETGFRWTEGKLAKIFFKTETSDKKNLSLMLASFYEPQDINIYLNDQLIGSKLIETAPTRLELPVSNKIKPGKNTVILKFSKNFQPVKVIPGSLDRRELAVKMFSFKID